MTTQTTKDVTRLLLDWSNGDREALGRLMPVVYEELRRLAARYLSRERPDHTLQPTALVHEAYLQLVDQRAVQWQGRAQFFGLAAQVMRNILVDHARSHRAVKRGSGARRLSLEEATVYSTERAADLIALDEAMQELAKLDRRKSHIIELRYFGGLDLEEIGEVLNISAATIRRDMRMAEAWLHRRMKDEG